MKKLFLIFLLLSANVSAQVGREGKLEFSGYIEAYFSYDFNRPMDHLRPDFLYNFKRHNEFSINLAVIKATYTEENIRASLALMGGTYAQYNLASEPAWAQRINEASVGVKLSEKVWFDVGVMPSYIGFESWYGMDCMHLSRSLLAENSPYFLTGGKFTFNPNPKWEIQFWLMNGWQNVQKVEGNQSLGLGLGVQYKPNEYTVINYSNYFGNENPQPIRLNRFYNNFFTMVEKDGWGFVFGVDYGIEQSLIGGVNPWYGMTASVQRMLGEKFTLAGRAEHYSDMDAVILNNGLRVSGLSANLDYRITEASMFRIEIRQFISPEAIFSLPEINKFSKGNTAVTGSLAIRF